MSNIQAVLLVLILALSVIITRFLPFILFGKMKEPPAIIGYLGEVLPAAMMGLLVVYCFKDYDFTSISQIFPALAATAVVVGLHLWKRNTILSILAGTVVYMFLIRVL